MTRIKSELVDRHLKLFQSDWDFLMEYTGPHSAVGLSPGEVVRGIVHQKVKWLRAKAIERVDQLGPGEGEKNAEIVKVLVQDREKARREAASEPDKSPEDLGF